MTDAQKKAAIRNEFVARQAAREDRTLAERQAETEAAIAATSVETRMPIAEGLAFLRSGGEREAA